MKTLRWVFTKGARCLQIWIQGIWLCFWVIRVADGILLLHSLSLLQPPKNKATVSGKEGHCFLLPTQVINGWGGRCLSDVLLFYTSIYLWAAESPRRLIIIGIRLSVIFQVPGNSPPYACFAWNFLDTPSVERDVSGFNLNPWHWLSRSEIDLYIHGLVMDGRLQGVSEELDPSLFSEVRPLQSNVRHKESRKNSRRALPHT